MVVELDGVRVSVVWLAVGAALTLTSLAGLVCYWLGWPYAPLLSVFVGTFGYVCWSKGERVFAAWEARQWAQPETVEESPKLPAYSTLYEQALVRNLLSRAVAHSGRDADEIPGREDLRMGHENWQDATDLLAEKGYITKSTAGTALAKGVTLGELHDRAFRGELELSPLPLRRPITRED